MFHCCSFQYDCTAVGRYYGLYFSLTVASFPHSSGLEGSVRNPSLFMVMSKASVLSVRVTHLTKLLWCENSAAIMLWDLFCAVTQFTAVVFHWQFAVVTNTSRSSFLNVGLRL